MITVSGLDGLITALEAAPERLMAATAEAMAVGAKLVETEARRLLELQSHRRGTKTPSQSGQPPAKIDGSLRDSVRADAAAVVSGSTATISVTTGLVYSHIQEFGGDAGRGHRSHLPARPYMKPATEHAAPLVVEGLATAARAALTG